MNAIPHEVYLTSDTHFGHEKIISFCKRPFANVQEMNEALIENWNNVVRPTDTIYHLGDFAMFNDRGALETLARLNGRKHLIVGNHDSRKVVASPLWESVKPYQDLKITYRGNLVRAVLCHYPIQDWRWRPRGGLHFHGHVHDGFAQTSQRVDVGVDSWNYRPVSLGQLIAAMGTFNPYVLNNWHDKAQSLISQMDLNH